MSGDVQPRKRKEKRRKKEDSEEITGNFSIDEHIHVHKDASTGGNICAKILFFLLSFVLLVMVGVVLFQYRGFGDDEALVPVSKWAPTFAGWLDETPAKHDEHGEEDSGEHGPAESGDHEDESVEEEEAVSKEASEEEGEHGSEEEETKHTKEEEEEEDGGDESEENNLEDEDSEERGGPDEDETEEEEDGEDETEEEDGEDETEEEDREDEEDHVPYRPVHRYSYKQIGKDIIDDDISDEGGDDNDMEESEEQESGRDEPDDDLEENDHESDENEEDLHEIPGITESAEDEGGNIDEALHEIPGVTESDEDEEGENVEQSGGSAKQQGKAAGIHEQSKELGSEEVVDVKKRESTKEVGDEISNVRTSENKVVEEEEDDESEPSGVALKFGVGVALVIVAHVVLVRKWNSDDNIASPDASNVVQSEPQHETPKVPKLVPQITVEQEIEKESEEMGYVASDYITRRQTLLPEDLVRDSPNRELEETDSSVPSEEEVDDGQEELVFKQNVYKAENAFKLSQRDEKPFSVEKSYKQQSFEELMKKYHELTPEGSESESEEEQEEEEEEDDDRELDEDELVDEDDLDNEDEDSEEDILQNKLLETKTITHPDAENKTPSKTEEKMMQIRGVGNTGKQQEELLDEDEDVGQQEEEEDEEDDEEPASEEESFNERFRQYEFSKSKQTEKGAEDSGSKKDIPVTKSKIPKNKGGQNAQVYSKADITNEDDWNIIRELDAADDDAKEGLNF